MLRGCKFCQSRIIYTTVKSIICLLLGFQMCAIIIERWPDIIKSTLRIQVNKGCSFDYLSNFIIEVLCHAIRVFQNFNQRKTLWRSRWISFSLPQMPTNILTRKQRIPQQRQSSWVPEECNIFERRRPNRSVLILEPRCCPVYHFWACFHPPEIFEWNRLKAFVPFSHWSYQ